MVPDLSVSTHVHHPGRALDFSLTSFAVPIVSRRLAGAIQELAGHDVQLLPVRIDDPTGVRTDMLILNATRLVRCLDERVSHFLKRTKDDHRADLAGSYRQVTKLVLDPLAIPADAQVFRVDAWEIALIVSEHVRTAMERVGCLGAQFIDVNPIEVALGNGSPN